jgi:hypothetical protein
MTRSTRRLRHAAGLLSYLLIVAVAVSRMLENKVKPTHLRQVLLLLCFVVVVSPAMAAGSALSGKPFVILISVDGLKPEAILDAPR